MSLALQVDESWPEKSSSELGVQDGRLVPPGTLDDPEVVGFDSDHVVVTPGWINAHSHLELSGIGSLEFNGRFLDWIHDVIDYKESVSETTIQKTYREATHQLLSSGVTRVVDHCDRTDLILGILDEFELNVHLQKELIAFADEQIDALKTEAVEFLDTLADCDANGGLAPHAPYSAHPALYEWASSRLDSAGLCMSTHLHEVESELEFSQTGSGSFLELLEERTNNRVESPYDGSRPLPYLVRKGVFDRPAFGVHLNYLNDEDRRWLKASRICPVFCPRSYTYFNHETRPVRDWIDAGIDFALGTDSLASNEGLDMLEELRRLDEILDDVEPGTILEALTMNPAEVIGLPSRGVLTWGTPADLSVFNVPSGDLRDLVRGQAEALATVIDGRVVWTNEP